MFQYFFYFKIFIRFQNEVTIIGKSRSSVLLTQLPLWLISYISSTIATKKEVLKHIMHQGVDCAHIALIRASIFKHPNKDTITLSLNFSLYFLVLLLRYKMFRYYLKIYISFKIKTQSLLRIVKFGRLNSPIVRSSIKILIFHLFHSTWIYEIHSIIYIQ